MPSPEEKLKQKALKQAERQAERETFRASVPIPVVQVRAMFDFIDQQLGESKCDNTLRHTLLFLSQNKMEAGPMIHWLEENHGYCDCEVLANTEERFLEAFPD
jgi:hypothetical protein